MIKITYKWTGFIYLFLFSSIYYLVPKSLSINQCQHLGLFARNIKMTCTRPPNFLLRKQKSLVCESVCQTAAIGTRERRLRLQKQYSVDHGRDISAHRLVNNNSSGQNQQKNGNSGNNPWGCSNASPEASLRIFTAIKNKTQSPGGESNEECVILLLVFFFSCFCIGCGAFPSLLFCLRTLESK